MMKLKQLICRLEEMSQAESRGATEKELIQGVKCVLVLILIEIDLDLINIKSNLIKFYLQMEFVLKVMVTF